MGAIQILQCAAAAIFDDPASAELMAQYSEECAIALIGKPAPSREMYEGLERSGMAQAFAAYEDGRMRGFAMVIVSVVPHYGLSCATVESIFSARGSWCGVQLMETVEEHARQAGCVGFFYAAPVGSRMARLLRLLSKRYTHTNEVFCRRLQ